MRSQIHGKFDAPCPLPCMGVVGLCWYVSMEIVEFIFSLYCALSRVVSQSLAICGGIPND